MNMIDGVLPKATTTCCSHTSSSIWEFWLN